MQTTMITAQERMAERTQGASRRWALWIAVAGFALLTWTGARIAVPLPFTPVPGTLQTVPVLLAGLVLGARAGAASQSLYLALGLMGLPVFAFPGAGPAYLLGPTGGYLLGFIAAAWTTGATFAVTRRFRIVGTLAALAAGNAALVLCGLAWLALQLGGDLGAAARAGFVPFVIFDLAKIAVAAALYAGCRGLGRLGWGWSDSTPR